MAKIKLSKETKIILRFLRSLMVEVKIYERLCDSEKYLKANSGVKAYVPAQTDLRGCKGAKETLSTPHGLLCAVYEPRVS